MFFAVPLRRHFLLESQLRFLSGTATAETIKSMFADARRAKSQVGTLIHASVFAAGTVVLTWCFPWVLRLPLFATLVRVRGEVGLGDTNRRDARGGRDTHGDEGRGERVGRGVCAWGMVGPWAASRGWVTGDPLSMKGGARGLLLWPGVTMMAVDSLMQLALATVCRPRRRRKLGGERVQYIRAEATKRRTKWTYDDVDADGSSEALLGGGGGDDNDEPGLLKSPDVLPKSKPTLVGWAGIEDGNVRDESSQPRR